jgi:hypothetical protein
MAIVKAECELMMEYWLILNPMSSKRVFIFKD